ncbi:hypothetical protein IQ07DRAFT_599636 [Pyrenochaeta sp. DS3sAY3a]|nr:hypothetical protein IQ07DRAFT_599636 [Pyrenochaeta sp. DS3sAY3a]
MALPRFSLSRRLWQRRKYSTSKAEGQETPNGWNIRRLVSEQFAKIRETQGFLPLRRSKKSSLFLWDRPVDYMGPKARIRHFYSSRHPAHSTLQTRLPLSRVPPPAGSHDLLETASTVGLVEGKIGYTFNNKIMCIEALKVPSMTWPLYFEGIEIKVGSNKRLALIGDRVLALSLCESWFQTGRTPLDYAILKPALESRSALYRKALAIDLPKCIIANPGSYISSFVKVSETLDAVLGAVYVDSHFNMQAVKACIKKLGLDQHEYLTKEGSVPLDPGVDSSQVSLVKPDQDRADAAKLATSTAYNKKERQIARVHKRLVKHRLVKMKLQESTIYVSAGSSTNCTEMSHFKSTGPSKDSHKSSNQDARGLLSRGEPIITNGAASGQESKTPEQIVSEERARVTPAVTWAPRNIKDTIVYQNRKRMKSTTGLWRTPKQTDSKEKARISPFGTWPPKISEQGHSMESWMRLDSTKAWQSASEETKTGPPDDGATQTKEPKKRLRRVVGASKLKWK